MPSPTTARGLLGNFLRGADPPAADQRVSPPPFQSPTSSSLRAISVAGAGGGGARGGAGGRRSLWDGRGGGRRARGINRDGRGMPRDTEETERDKAKGTAGTNKDTGGRPQTTENPPAQRSDNGSGGKYRAGGSNTEESADKSADWGGEETEECRGVGRFQKANDGNGRGIRGKRRGRRSRGCIGQRVHSGWRGSSGRRQRGRSGRPPWGENRGKVEGFRPAGKPGQRVLWSGRRRGGQIGLWSGKRYLCSDGRRRRPQGLWSDRKPQGGAPGSGRGS